MHSFKDRNGKTWEVSLSVSAVSRVKAITGLDLLDLREGGAIEKLANDPILLANSLYAVCKPQCDQQGITDEEFGEGLCGDSIERASDAFMEEYVDFFPNATQRKAMRRAKEAGDSLQKEAEKLLDSKIDMAIEKARRELATRLESLSFGSLGLSESTQANGHSANSRKRRNRKQSTTAS